MRIPARSRSVGVLCGALILAAGICIPGCLNPFAPRIAPTLGISEPPPVPNTPQNLLRLFEWCWNHRAISEYRELFSGDFQFVFALRDSAGNPVRDPPLTREQELDIAENLFVRGTATEPPANRIQLVFDANLIAHSDSRPGKNPIWHKEIGTQVNLSIDTDTENFRITGNARFFVVRGDSAVMPQELLDRGASRTDVNRWYIERWEDETIGSSEASARARRVPGLFGAVVPGGTTWAAPGRTPAIAASAGPAHRTAAPTLDVTWSFVKRFYR